ncbi:TatD family hydrolase [Acaryochloris sp. IP29b_bin.137]|uniref:TatD family hydrolase n=1 Tax=Acaryochloris sp. IP29b_bin.137 TaxID=2969217 RepID=UPI00261AD100|nr:TatD family hydrolase [Acaryochloris sp. IP29b_bin.137]
MQLIDTHVHLNFDAFQPDLDQIAQRWRDHHIVRLVHSCVEPSEFKQIQNLAQQFPELYYAVGVHPLDVDKWDKDAETQMQLLAQSDPKVVAIGETGLDFFKADNGEQQQQVFWAHLLMARLLQLPVIIHCREAAVPMRQLLQQFWHEQGPVNGVMHCWGGTPEETQWFLDLGFYVSFSGIVTFKNAKQVHQSARMVPCDRILIETDCPFLAPVPVRGERRNEPANVRYVAQQVADLRGISLEQLATTTTQNACRLFQLSLPVQS